MSKFIRTFTPKGASVIAPYSVGKIHNNVLYLSGQIGFVPGTSKLVSDSVEDQTKQIMSNVQAMLAEANSSLEHILKCVVYLTDMSDFQKVNAIYGGFFKQEPPARVCVAVKELPANAKVEIEVTAVVE